MRYSLALILALGLSFSAQAESAGTVKPKVAVKPSAMVTSKVTTAKKSKSAAKSKVLAKAKGPHRQPSIKILSFQQLMRLSPKRRFTYLRDLRKLIVRLESRRSKFEVANNDLPTLREQIARMMHDLEMLPTADAQLIPSVALVQPLPGRPNWVDGKGWVCSDPGLIFNPRAGTCVLGNLDAPMEVYYNGTGPAPCPTGAQAIPDPGYAMFNSYFVCVPKTSWDLLTPDRQTAILQKRWLPEGHFRVLDQARTAAEVIGRDPGVVAPAGAVAESAVPANRPITSADIREDLRRKRLAAQGVTTPDPNNEPFVPPLADGPVDAPAIDTAAAADPAAADAGAGEDAICAEGAFVCKDIYDLKAQDPNGEEYLAAQGAIDLFRADRAEGSNVCISGGFFSSYRTAEKSRGSCKIVRSFPESAASPCKANEALCNPLLFCMASDVGDGKKAPHQKCVPFGRTVGYDITRRCNVWYEQVRTAGVDEVERNGQVFQNVPTKACDAGSDIDYAAFGPQEEWARLKTVMDQQFQKWCMPQTGDQNFQALFCSECKVMAAIRARAVGGCKGGVVTDPAPAVTEAAPAAAEAAPAVAAPVVAPPVEAAPAVREAPPTGGPVPYDPDAN